jgi:acetylornithine deacetylase/succinyl-diaminopimelate desuccinylase-like protein
MLKTGVGGYIGFVNTIQKMFQDYGTIIHNTGLGPSNAHGADEYIDLNGTKKFTGVLAYLFNSITENNMAAV